MRQSSDYFRLPSSHSSFPSTTLSPQTGERIGSLELKDPVYLEPISVGDKVFVLTDDARLVAIR